MPYDLDPNSACILDWLVHRLIDFKHYQPNLRSKLKSLRKIVYVFHKRASQAAAEKIMRVPFAAIDAHADHQIALMKSQLVKTISLPRSLLEVLELSRLARPEHFGFDVHPF